MSKRLRTEQLIAIGYIAQPKNGGLTLAQIAEECGVSERTIYNWLRDDTFLDAMKREQRNITIRHVPDVVQAMVKTAKEDGNAAAAKLILQVAGQLTENVRVEHKESDVPDVDELRRMVDEINE